MNHTLTITVNDEPAVVERLLQITRYRGFRLCGLDLKPLADTTGLLITLSVVSDKPVQLLTSQLNKLYDIKSLELATPDVAALRA
ncbi:acetolactate synthase 2 small subunit [Chromatiaceae bacterium AAb-1]|nr:acetolactate synthase 2 small subunit [Chromatiaceae bacterium AAb-1]